MSNPYFAVPLVVWAITQFLKFIIAAFAGRIDFRYLYASGGMPSVHSAVVTSLATTSFLVDGPNSSIFGLTIIVAAIVMYDSFGVRRSSGEQAVAINLILQGMEAGHIGQPQRPLREMLGHKPMEVAAGALLGLTLGGLFNYSRLHPLFAVIARPVALPYIYAVALLAAVVLITGIVGRIVYGGRYRHIGLILTLVKRSALAAYVLGILGLVLAFLQYEKIAAALWAVWPVLYLIAVLAAIWLLWWPKRKQVPVALGEYASTADKAKWLEGPNKKRRAAAARSRKRR